MVIVNQQKHWTNWFFLGAKSRQIVLFDTHFLAVTSLALTRVISFGMLVAFRLWHLGKIQLALVLNFWSDEVVFCLFLSSNFFCSKCFLQIIWYPVSSTDKSYPAPGEYNHHFLPQGMKVRESIHQFLFNLNG